jgi:hypothetical protein
MAKKEIVVKFTGQELELLSRALSEYEAKRASDGLNTDEAAKLQKKLDDAR